MKIDLVFPRFKLLSGAERLILGVAEALAAAGHQPRIVCHQFDESCRPRLAPGVELQCSGKRLDWARNRYLNAIFDYARTLQLSGWLDPGAGAHVCFGPALPLAWYRKRVSRSSVPVLYFCYEPPRALYQDRQLVLRRLGLARFLVAPLLTIYRGLDRRFVRAVDAVCTNSHFSASRIETCYGRAAAVITHGVDRERFDAAQPADGGSPERAGGERPVLLTVNYLHPRKRVDLAIQAVALMDESVDSPLRSSELRVVGDGPERDKLERLAEQLGVADRVTFTGFVDDDALPGYYWRATAYVHTTREESLGLSVIEAAYCGCPVVAVDEGGVSETVKDGATGLLVAATAEAIAAGIRDIVEQPDRGAGMGQRGRDRVIELYSWERGAEELLAAVRRVD